MFLLRSLSVRFVRVLGGFSYSPRVKLKHLSINQSVASTAFAISLTIKGATGSSPLFKRLDNCDEIGPTEAAEASLLHIPVAGAAPGLRAFPSAVDVLAAECGVESAERLTDGAVFLGVDEATARGGTHLAFCLLNEKGFGGSHQGGAGLGGDGRDVACYESIVGGGDDGGHILVCLLVELRLFH